MISVLNTVIMECEKFRLIALMSRAGDETTDLLGLTVRKEFRFSKQIMIPAN